MNEANKGKELSHLTSWDLKRQLLYLAHQLWVTSVIGCCCGNWPMISRVLIEFSSQLSISLCNFIFMRALLQKDFFVALSKWAWKRNCHIICLIFLMRTKNNFRLTILISSGTLQRQNKHRRWPMSGVALINNKSSIKDKQTARRKKPNKPRDCML